MARSQADHVVGIMEVEPLFHAAEMHDKEGVRRELVRSRCPDRVSASAAEPDVLDRVPTQRSASLERAAS